MALTTYNPQTPEGEETFLQRQKRLQGTQAAQQTQPLVTNNSGSQAPTNTYRPPTPATQQPTTPTAQAQNNGPTAQAGTPLQPVNLGNDPFKTYTPTQVAVPVPTVGNLPSSYSGSNITQFNAPDQQPTQDAQLGLINKILANPQTMNPAVIGALKEKAKEGALMMEQQGVQQGMSNAAALGRSSGGFLGDNIAQARSNAGNMILNSNRDIDIAAAERNRADELAALAAAESVLSGQVGRATQGYGATLAGETAQAGDIRNVAQDAIQRAILGNNSELAAADLDLRQQGINADERFRGFTTERDAQDAAINRILQQFGINEGVVSSARADRGLDVQERLGNEGLAIDRSRLSEQGRQFDKSFGLNVLDFLQRGSQFNDQMGLQYNQLGLNGQQQLLNFINSIL